jgi:hypothetical protein
VTVAHIAGLPFEELLGPLVASGGGVLLALCAACRRLQRRA